MIRLFELDVLFGADGTVGISLAVTSMKQSSRKQVYLHILTFT